MGGFTIAVMNKDLVIGVVAVVGWLIAQALSHKKNQTPPPRPPHPPATGHGDRINPNDDLRKFFQDLKRGLTGQVDPAEQPVRHAPPPPMQHHRPTRPPHISSRQGEPMPVSLQPLPAYLQAALEREPVTISGKEYAQRPEKFMHKWAAGYTHRENLRQMIVATEVLAPPLALRKPGAMSSN